MNQDSSIPSSAPRHRRHWRNFLLDKRFQFKYAAYLAGTAALLSVFLGALLVNTSRAVIEQSQAAVRQGEQVVRQGQMVLTESQKVSAVVQMNIARVPDYAENPELAQAFRKDSEAQDARLASQQDALKRQAEGLRRQSQALASQQRSLLLSIFGVLAALVIALGAIGIVVTHRVAGPLFKMKRQLKRVGDGHLTLPPPLRKGDELVDFFGVLEQTVQRLRDRQEHEIAVLKEVASLMGEEPEEAKKLLGVLKGEKQAALK